MNHTERNDRGFHKITQLNFRIGFDLNAKPFRGLGERLIGRVALSISGYSKLYIKLEC